MATKKNEKPPTPGTLQRTRLELRPLLGSEWDGWAFMPAPGGPCIDDYPQAIYLFQHPSWRRAFNVKDLQQMFYDIQRLAQVQHERDRAKRELEAATEALHAAEARAEYYRQQLRAESRLGLMLTRLAAI